MGGLEGGLLIRKRGISNKGGRVYLIMRPGGERRAGLSGAS
jgi:hypothetical protein